jgi:hypothetical protein
MEKKKQIQEKRWRKNQKFGDKEFLELYYIGYNDSEIGRKLNCASGTVRHRRVRFGLIANAKPLGASQEIKTEEELKKEYRDAVRHNAKVYHPIWDKRTSNQRLAKENKQLRNEVERWKETCEILSNQEILKSIKISLIQISRGKRIPLSQLNLKEDFSIPPNPKGQEAQTNASHSEGIGYP